MSLAPLHRYFRPHGQGALSRRNFMGAAAALGALLPTAAHALTTELRVLPGTLPEREGVLAWSKLTAAEFGDFTKPATVPAEVTALHGTTVRLEGYVLPFDEAATSREFLLTGLQAHCVYCMPGGMGNIAYIELSQAAKVAPGVALVEGQLEVVPDNLGGPIYKLKTAQIVSL